MNNKVYDVLKYIALIAMPALATLVSALGSTWGLENVDKITATITALNAFLGALLGIASVKYHKEND